MARIGMGAEYQHAGYDTAIFIGGESADAQHVDGVGNAVANLRPGVGRNVGRGIEKRRNIAILRHAAKQVRNAGNHVGIEKEPVAGGEHQPHALQQFALAQGKRAEIAQAVAHPQPAQ